MLKDGEDIGVPEIYRITLAASVALLAHLLVVVTLPLSLPGPDHHPVTLSVQLSPQGSAPSRQNAGSSSARSVLAEPFHIDNNSAPDSTANALNAPTTARPQPRTVPEPEPETAFAGSESADIAPESGAPASAPSLAGQQATPPQDRDQPLTLKSTAPSEANSYLALLVQTIASNARIPKLDDFNQGQTLSVELELSLMANGALVGARIAESSGNEGLDQRVYLAALAASPYPEPPASNTRQRRFRVEVRYTF